MTVFSQIAKLWRNRTIDPESPKDTTATGFATHPGFAEFGGEKTAIDEFFDSLFGVSSRQQLYSIYKDIEESTPEIARGLDIYADYAVSGSTIENTSSIRVTSNNRVFDRRLRRIEQNIQLASKAWRIVRCMCQYGDAFYENVFSSVGLQALKVLPRAQMFRREDGQGRLVGFDQKTTTQKEPVFLEPWQVSHFRLVVDDEEKYGRSILWSIKREALELMLMRSGMTITRLSRAHRRLIHNIDVGDAASESEKEVILAKAKARNQRQRIMDPRTGRMSLRANPLRAEEDIYVPTRKDGMSSVEVLQGDDSLQKIDDVLFKRAALLSGLGISESWLGLTGPNIRNVADHQTINFLKTIRRVRRDFAAVAIVPYQIALMMQGIPWERVFLGGIDIAFPKMSLVEDRLRLEIDEVRTKISEKILDQGLMSRLDVLVLIYEHSIEEATRLLANLDEERVSRPVESKNGERKLAMKLDRLTDTQRSSILEAVLEAAYHDPTLRRGLDNVWFLLEEIKQSVEYRGLE